MIGLYKFSRFSEGLALSIRAGFCFAGVAIALKFSQQVGEFSQLNYGFFILFHFVGFSHSQKALSRAPIKIVIPISALLSMFIPVLVGWSVLEESVNLNRIAALCLAMLAFYYFAKERIPNTTA